MTPTLPMVLSTALALGALHAFDPDHLAAITAFISRRPSVRAGATFAARWGLGHSFTLIAVGLATALFRLALPRGIEIVAELAVGLTLVGVGGWALAGVRRAGPSGRVVAGRSIFWIGALHGLAGSAGLMVVVPMALISSPAAVLAYIAVFSAGVTAAMALYAAAVGRLFGGMADGAAPWYPWLAAAAGSITLLLGLGWISMTLASHSV